jgi:phenylpropionate dioxygenase-like ring-hydroxylating dioxygenase large terminal subunit
MLKNFWYAVEFSEAVASDEPKRLRVLGQDLVLYRDSQGTIVCMSDLCIHRGGALSDGTVEGDCIRCPYHGWVYEAGGACVEIPANAPGTPIPKRARVDAYPAEDRYGWIWVFLGDLPEAERPGIPVLPHIGDSAYYKLTGEFKWDAHYARVMENAIDFAHAPFVHGSVFGNPDEPEIEQYDVNYGDLGATATITMKPTPSKGLWSRLYPREPSPVITTNGFWMPNITRLEVQLPMGTMILYDANVPVDDFTTITKWMQFRTFFKGKWADRDSIRRVERIFLQDQKTVEAQRPELLPYDLAAELHVKADNIQIAYRQMRNQYLDKGYGIDMHLIESEYSRHQAVVIPSPGRRENPEFANAWVMKEVPTRGGAGDNGKNGDIGENG